MSWNGPSADGLKLIVDWVVSNDTGSPPGAGEEVPRFPCIIVLAPDPVDERPDDEDEEDVSIRGERMREAMKS